MVGAAGGTTAAFFGKAASAIEARAERIAADMTAEMGKPSARRASRRSAPRTIRATRAARPGVRSASLTRRCRTERLYTLRRPIGVVGSITPWNFPIAIPVWKLAPP